jgi:Fe-S-cluster containining protein
MGLMKLPVVSQPETEPWYADGLRFTCTQCGNCCTGGPGYVWISSVEIDRLAEHLKLSRQETIELHCRRLGARYSLNEHRDRRGNYDCCFLEERNVKEPGPGGGHVTVTRRVCTIYPVRPLQCRTWPFWDGNLASRKNWEHAAERCPGMGRGRLFNRDKINALNGAQDWPEAPPSSK